MTARQIAIDGPAGAGKSTIAKLVAKRLGYTYMDTGAMYRAVALLALERGVDLTDPQALGDLTTQADIRLETGETGCRVWLNGEEVTEAIRRPEVGNAASAISVAPQVREALVRQQQSMAAEQPVVMDGRDIGTVVLPQAECKIFLTASALVRAQRRTKELREKGIPADLAQIQREIEERDQRDSQRAVSPLRQADDAVLLDTSGLTIPQVVEKVLSIAEAAQ